MNALYFGRAFKGTIPNPKLPYVNFKFKAQGGLPPKG